MHSSRRLVALGGSLVIVATLFLPTIATPTWGLSAKRTVCTGVGKKRKCVVVPAKTTAVAATTTQVPATMSTTTTSTTIESTTTTTSTVAPSTTTTIPLSPAEQLKVTIRQRFAASGGVVIEGESRFETVDCGGRSLTIRGNGLNVISTNCSPVLIDGSSNAVTIDQTPGLSILGDLNKVGFRSGGANGITIVGNSNRVGPA